MPKNEPEVPEGRKSSVKPINEKSTNTNSKPMKNGNGLKNGEKERSEKAHDRSWIMTVLLLTTAISFTIGFITELIYTVIAVSLWRIIVAICLLSIIIVVNIIADMMGIAATSADEEPFLAMASRKIAGSKRAVMLCRNADRVSSILNDIIGDVCGIISGASGATISAVLLSNYTNLELVPTILISVGVSTLIAVVTITGKAVAKKSATRQANEITMRLAKLLSIFDKEK